MTQATADYVVLGIEPDLSVPGVAREHGARAARWLRNRSILAYYHGGEESLRAPVTVNGRQWTCDAMDKALAATR